jgi:hypothetical protein
MVVQKGAFALAEPQHLLATAAMAASSLASSCKPLPGVATVTSTVGEPDSPRSRSV